MKRKLYILRTQDIFEALGLGQLTPDQFFLSIGTLWATIGLTDEEFARYKFPIRPHTT